MRKNGEQGEAEHNQQDKRGNTFQTGARQIGAQHTCGEKSAPAITSDTAIVRMPRFHKRASA